MKKNNTDLINKNVVVKWHDAYNEFGWKDLSDFSASTLIATTWGKVIYENDKVISLAHTYADETENTSNQVNGIMTIPKSCIVKITSL